MDETDSEIMLMFRWGIAVVLLCILAALMWGAVLPTVLHQQADANRNSYQNITAIRTQLQHDMTAYARIEGEIGMIAADPQYAAVVTSKHAEQIHLLDEMRTLAQQIPASDVPPDITQFLKEHTP